MTDWWDGARVRAMEGVRREIRGKFPTLGAVLDAEGSWDELPMYTERVAPILRQGWLPRRPARRMPRLSRIAEYWEPRGIFQRPPHVPPGWPYCFACHRAIEPDDDDTPLGRRWDAALGLLERAHLVDRWCGGLDGPQNIVPLCCRCHRSMPMFRVGEGPEAICWVQQHDRWSVTET